MLFAKIIPKFKHCTWIEYEISISFHRGTCELLGRTRQENILSEAICRDFLCFIFKVLKNKRLGTIIKIITRDNN